MGGAVGGDGATGARFRRPAEADHARIAAVADEWCGGRGMRARLPRLWFQHFTGTSWLAEAPDGAPLGFLVGFLSPDDPAVACVHLAAVSPGRRRRGIGSELYRRFCEDAAARGAREVRTIAWAGDRAAVAFHLALGFRADDGPGTQRLYGTTAYPDYEGDGRDAVVLRRPIAPPARAAGHSPQRA